MDSADPVKEEMDDYFEDDIEQMDMIADEITIGSDKMEAPSLFSHLTSRSSVPQGNVRFIRLPLASGDNSGSQQFGQINKPVRIITLPSRNSMGSAMKTISVVRRGDNLVPTSGSLRPANTVLKLASTGGRVIHLKTATPNSSNTSKGGAIFVARPGEDGMQRTLVTPMSGGGTVLRATPAITRRTDGSMGSARQFIIAQKQWYTRSGGISGSPTSPNTIQVLTGGGGRPVGGVGGTSSQALARALSTATGGILPHANPVLDVNSEMADSGDEGNSAYTAAMKSNGLRKYAQSVCQKVKEKSVTSYNEVADELVQEYAAENPMIPQDQLQYHQKNIRRRVYDALNVLMAMQIISKEKKEIRWVGLPINALQERKRLEGERDRKLATFKTKVQQIEETIMQLISYKTLIGRNRAHEKMFSEPASNSIVELPFITLTTHRKAVINCNISDDKLTYQITVDQPPELRDHMETLRSLGLNLDLGSDLCSEAEYQQCLELVPPVLRFYVEALYERRPPIEPDLDAVHEQRRHYLEAKLAAAASGGFQNSSLRGPSGGHSSVYGADHIRHHSSYVDGPDADDDELDDLEVDEDVEPSDDDMPGGCSDEEEDTELDVG